MKRIDEWIFRFRAAIFLGMTAFGLSQCYACTSCDKMDYHTLLESQEDDAFFVDCNSFGYLMQTGRGKEAEEVYSRLLTQGIIPEFTNKEGYIEAENLHKYFRSDEVRQCFKKAVLKFGLACKDSSVIFTENDSLSIKICDCKATKSQDKYKKIEDCKSNCNSVAALVGAAVCYSLPRPCQIACVGAIEALRRRCEYCCQTTSFYDSCIRPLHSFDPPPCDWNEKD